MQALQQVRRRTASNARLKIGESDVCSVLFFIQQNQIKVWYRYGVEKNERIFSLTLIHRATARHGVLGCLEKRSKREQEFLPFLTAFVVTTPSVIFNLCGR